MLAQRGKSGAGATILAVSLPPGQFVVELVAAYGSAAGDAVAMDTEVIEFRQSSHCDVKEWAPLKVGEMQSCTVTQDAVATEEAMEAAVAAMAADDRQDEVKVRRCMQLVSTSG